MRNLRTDGTLVNHFWKDENVMDELVDDSIHNRRESAKSAFASLSFASKVLKMDSTMFLKLSLKWKQERVRSKL